MVKVKQAISESVVVVRGGGDLATGVVQKLYHAGFKVVILETAKPLAIRRTVALCDAVFQGKKQVEDMTAVFVSSTPDCEACWQKQQIPLLIDPQAKAIHHLKPLVVVDAILAKKKLRN